MNDKEILKPVIYNGKKIKEYYVTNMGTVYSCYRGGVFDPHTRTILKPQIKNGYMYVKLILENGVGRACGIHKLVLNSFKPLHEYLPPFINRRDFHKSPKSIQSLLSEVLIINHIDHDKKNNRLNNLERMTSRQNTLHSAEYRRKAKTTDPDSKMCTICKCSKNSIMFHPKRNQCKVCYSLRQEKSRGLKEQEQNKQSPKTKVENIVPDSKTCTICNCVKSLTMFDPKRNQCKVCYTSRRNETRALKKQEENKQNTNTKVENIVPEIKIVTELRTCSTCNFTKKVTMFPGKKKKCKDCTSVYQRHYRDMRKAEKMSNVPIGETLSPELIYDYDDISTFL